MMIRSREAGKAVVVDVLVPEIDYTVSGELKDRIMDLVTKEGWRRMCINLKDVQFMDSKSIGALVAVRNAVVERQGRLAVCNLHPYVRKIFSVVTLNVIFDIHETEAEALEALEAQEAQ
jgi:anti-anti-sigma factor